MANTNKYKQPVLTTESVIKKLENASPLQASKVLIDMELYDQKSSLNVMENIYEEFEGNNNIVNELVEPIALNILDSVIFHPKLKGLKLQEKGVTPSRLWNDCKHFSYDINPPQHNEDPLVNKAKTISNEESFQQDINSKKATRYYRTRSDAKEGLGVEKTERFMDNEQRKNYSKKFFRGNKTKLSEIEKNHDGSQKRIWRQKDSAPTKEGLGRNNAEIDHVISTKSVNFKFTKHIGLKPKDLQDIANIDENFSAISAGLNNLKREDSWAELQQKKASAINKKKEGVTLTSKEEKLLKLNNKTIKNGLEADRVAQKAMNNKVDELLIKNVLNDKNIRNKVLDKTANKSFNRAEEQSKNQLLGTAIIKGITPLLFELYDLIKNGILHGTNETSVLKAITFRFKRMYRYIVSQVLPTIKEYVKDFFKNFLQNFFNALTEFFKGILQSIFKVISEGFNAIIQAIKIIKKPNSEMSQAEKSDAITKLIATTVVTFTVFYFGDTILKPLEGTIFKDIILAIVSGIGSTLVVYGLDKLDLFSVKDEKRALRVKEVFDMRIQQIKENTDAFESTAIEKLAKDKLQFRSITEKMSKAIDSKSNVNDSVYDMADFMKIDLKIKSTDDFMDLLKQGSLAI